MTLENILLKGLLTRATLNHPWLLKHRHFNNCIKMRLDNFWSNQDVLYDFNALFLGIGSGGYS